MQTLPLDRKSPGQSTRCASTAVTLERPSEGPPWACTDSENDGNLAEFGATSGSALHALAHGLEQLGRGLLRIGVEPLAYTAGLLARLAQQCRQLMEMGHRPPARKDNAHPTQARINGSVRARGSLRKTHRLAGWFYLRGPRELHQPAKRVRALHSARARTQRRISRCVARAAQPPCPPG